MNVNTKDISRSVLITYHNHSELTMLQYWNWAKYKDLTVSPIFNGDEWSLGGNGEAVTHKGGFVGRQIPAGPRGGCVKTGPFAK